MSAAYEPSMDEILRSIRRIIRSDKDQDEQPIAPPFGTPKAPAALRGQDNLIQMKLGDQDRVRIFEKKLQAQERDYEAKLAAQKKQAVEYYKRNQELVGSLAEHKQQISALLAELRIAHSVLEKLQSKNKSLKDQVEQSRKDYSGFFVLQTIKHEIDKRFRPVGERDDRVGQALRLEIYNEFNKILLGIRDRLRGKLSS